VSGDIGSMQAKTICSINHSCDMLQASRLSASLDEFDTSYYNERKPLPEVIEKTTVGQKRNSTVIETTAISPDEMLIADSITSISNSDDINVTLTKIKQIKQEHIALMEAKENNWNESHDILRHIYEIERKMALQPNRFI